MTDATMTDATTGATDTTIAGAQLLFAHLVPLRILCRTATMTGIVVTTETGVMTGQ